jgi:hypothetical protein
VAQAAGKTVRFSGYIRTEGVTTGFAGLWWRVDGAPGKTLAFDNMSTRGATGTADWRPFSLELRVDTSAKNINFGLLMPGNGTAWFDDLKIELNGEPFTDATVFDPDFESGSIRGFGAGGNGYRVTLDNAVAHGGRQSLRMTRVAPVDTGPPIDRTAVVGQWNDVLTRLERQRASYRALGATDRDIDWTIQNARVVLQAVQMRLNLVSRDRSMALNVKWILDQNPNAKIVLWAHNGHVARGRMMIRVDGRGAARHVRRTDGGAGLRVQSRLVSGDRRARRRTAELHRCAGTGWFVRRVARHGGSYHSSPWTCAAPRRHSRGSADTANRRGILERD